MQSAQYDLCKMPVYKSAKLSIMVYRRQGHGSRPVIAIAVLNPPQAPGKHIDNIIVIRNTQYPDRVRKAHTGRKGGDIVITDYMLLTGYILIDPQTRRDYLLAPDGNTYDLATGNLLLRIGVQPTLRQCMADGWLIQWPIQLDAADIADMRNGAQGWIV